MVDELFGGYGPITSQVIEDPQQMARRKLAEIRRLEEIERRQREAEQMARNQMGPSYGDRRAGFVPAQPEDTRSYGQRRAGFPRPTRPQPTEPTTVELDGRSYDLQQYLQSVPDRLDAEARISLSPLADVARSRQRVQELVGEGLSPGEAAVQAEQERSDVEATQQHAFDYVKSGHDRSTVRREGVNVVRDFLYSGMSMANRLIGRGKAASEWLAAKEGADAATMELRELYESHPEVIGLTSDFAKKYTRTTLSTIIIPEPTNTS